MNFITQWVVNLILALFFINRIKLKFMFISGSFIGLFVTMDLTIIDICDVYVVMAN